MPTLLEAITCWPHSYMALVFQPVRRITISRSRSGIRSGSIIVSAKAWIALDTGLAWAMVAVRLTGATSRPSAY